LPDDWGKTDEELDALADRADGFAAVRAARGGSSSR